MIDHQKKLIDLLYDENEATKKMKELKQRIERDQERLAAHPLAQGILKKRNPAGVQSEESGG